MSSSRSASSVKRLTLLTKSLFKTATTCPRKLRYATNPKLYPRQDTANSLLASLAEEGRKFELYCRTKKYGDGVEIGPAGGSGCLEFDADDGSGESYSVNDAIVDDMVEQTRTMLLDGSEPTTIFEGAIRHNNYFVRTDVLQRIGNTISIIEIKAKSWDSSTEDNPMVGKRGGIKSDFLQYIHDVAFQKMVVEGAYPKFEVKAFLMMPDKARVTELTNLNRMVDDMRRNNDEDTAEKARKTIVETSEEDLTALVDVTELVDSVIEDKLVFPGSNKETFVEAAEQWADNVASSGEDAPSSPPPIGSHCKSCEYRLNGKSGATANGTISGFDTCWKEATGMEPGVFQKGSAVIDLWHGSQKNLSSFIANGQYRLSDLSYEDLGFTEDGVEMKKKKSSSKDEGMSRSRRQLYQAKGFPMKPSSSEATSFLLDSEYLLNEMDSWRYPYHFIDFETATPALPYFAGMAPFDMVAFQFSHHILHQDGRIEHASQFLHAEPGICPNEAFLRALGESVGGCNGSVFRWGVHENTVLAALLRKGQYDDEVTDKIQPLLRGGDRAMVDLMKAATQGYFVSGSDGSSSIKRLLSPTIQASARLNQYYGVPSYSSRNFTDMQWFQRDDDSDKVRDPYDILAEYDSASGAAAVADGGAAVAAYHALQCNDLSLEDRSAIESSLLRYCELDTLAMAMIVQAWQGFLEEE